MTDCLDEEQLACEMERLLTHRFELRADGTLVQEWTPPCILRRLTYSNTETTRAVHLRLVRVGFGIEAQTLMAVQVAPGVVWTWDAMPGEELILR